MTSRILSVYNVSNIDSANQKRDIERFVNNQSGKTAYHSPNFLRVVPNIFGHDVIIIVAKENDEIVGVLPIVITDSIIFGKYATSLPYFNYGGALVTRDELLDDIINFANFHTKSLGCKRFQLRSASALEREDAVLNDTKVNMLLNLPEDISSIGEGNAKKRAKLRSQAQLAVRKSNELNIEIKQVFGTFELLNDFYKVFAEHMRDLGTPVYSKRFFEAMLKNEADQCTLSVAYLNKKPVSCGFLIRDGDKMEIPWASTLRSAHHLSMNSHFYWNILDYAIKTGVKTFDFGRSTVDEGTYKFKKQWGAVPEQCFWYTWDFGDEPQGELHPKNPKFKLAIQVWKKLPLCLANFIGPKVAKSLP